MKNDESNHTKMMPAICTHCGGQVEVDAQRENAICQYCGMQFIVEKAIDTYNVQHATIEHVNSINIVKTSAVESVLNFVKDQQKRNDDIKKEKKEEERKAREEDRKVREEQEKKIREEAERRKQQTPKLSPLGRGCITGLLVMIVCTVLIGLPAQALDKSLFNVVSTTGSESTYGPLFSVASFLIFFVGIIGFAYGWAPKAKIWILVILWIQSKFKRNKGASPTSGPKISSPLDHP